MNRKLWVLFIISLVLSSQLVLISKISGVYAFIPTTQYSLSLMADNSTSGNSTNTTQPSNTTQSSMNQISIDRVFYIPCTVTLNFPSTTNTALGNISTIGSGQYNYAGNDVSFSFIAKDVDVYTFAFTINYLNVSDHDILIAWWEGDRAMQGETWSSLASSYTVFFKLSTTNEPLYPSAAAVANQSMYQFQQLFLQLLQANKESADSAQTMSVTSGVVSAMAGVISILALVFALHYARRRRIIPLEGE